MTRSHELDDLSANKQLLLETAKELLAKETLSEDELRPYAARLAHV